MIRIFKHIDRHMLININTILIVEVIYLKISARNLLKGNVEVVNKGPITSTVKIKIESPTVITAIITKESVEDMDIKEGDEVIAVVKSTEVMIAKE